MMDCVTLYAALFILYSIWGENMKVAEFNGSKINICCFHLVPSFQSIHYLRFKAALSLFPAVAPKACWVFLHHKQLAMFADGKPVRDFTLCATLGMPDGWPEHLQERRIIKTSRWQVCRSSWRGSTTGISVPMVCCFG